MVELLTKKVLSFFVTLVYVSFSVRLVSSFVVVGNRYHKHHYSDFTTQRRHACTPTTMLKATTATTTSKIVVPASELEKDLTIEEQKVVAVVRNCGKSVAFVTSVLAPPPSSNTKKNATDPSLLPSGPSLGSGSAFLVHEDGYLVTNYHVIERAYELQKMNQNITNFMDTTLSFMEPLVTKLKNEQLSQPQIYVRIDSTTNYQLCNVVDVRPELDIAVLKIKNMENFQKQPILKFGSSSNVLVGQSVIAIGNPFGLDTTVTTGVISAVNREIQTRSSRQTRRSSTTPLRNCLQTDAAINPGNSGGPLLNLKNEIIGVNTAILSTSGSNSGIGFAIPSDPVSIVVNSIIRNDRVRNNNNGNKQYAYLGIETVEIKNKVYITKIRNDSPLFRTNNNSIRTLKIDKTSGCILSGDAIVAIGGNTIQSYKDLQNELDTRSNKEQNVPITIEEYNAKNSTASENASNRRIIYVSFQ